MSREVLAHGDEYRDVAAAYHGGQWSPMYAYASTGSVIEGLIAEIAECIALCPEDDTEGYYDLLGFRDYVEELLS